MKRSPIKRNTPLRANPKDAWKPAEPVAMNLDAARTALRLRAASANVPRTFTPPQTPPPTTAKGRSGEFTERTRSLIIYRDRATCQMCGVLVGIDVGYSIQHRIARKSGGTRDPIISLPSNGILMCGSGTTGCHGKVTQKIDLGEQTGFVVQSWADPASVPVHTHHGWVHLDNDGRSHTTAPPPPGEGAHWNAAKRRPFK